MEQKITDAINILLKAFSGNDNVEMIKLLKSNLDVNKKILETQNQILEKLSINNRFLPQTNELNINKKSEEELIPVEMSDEDIEKINFEFNDNLKNTLQLEKTEQNKEVPNEEPSILLNKLNDYNSSLDEVQEKTIPKKIKKETTKKNENTLFETSSNKREATQEKHKIDEKKISSLLKIMLDIAKVNPEVIKTNLLTPEQISNSFESVIKNIFKNDESFYLTFLKYCDMADISYLRTLKSSEIPKKPFISLNSLNNIKLFKQKIVDIVVKDYNLIADKLIKEAQEKLNNAQVINSTIEEDRKVLENMGNDDFDISNVSSKEELFIKKIVGERSKDQDGNLNMGSFKLLNNEFIEYEGSKLYRIEYIESCFYIKNNKRFEIKQGVKGGYCSKKAFVGKGTIIAPSVKIMDYMLIEEGVELFNKKLEFKPFQRLMNKKSYVSELDFENESNDFYEVKKLQIEA